MPVALNEPLNMLQVSKLLLHKLLSTCNNEIIFQRLCEELEYSELLDKAAELDDPYERMVYVAAFAVSSYASSTYRAGNKPFNPLLGETYECIREDKGFKFLGEQVSVDLSLMSHNMKTRKYFFFWDNFDPFKSV